MVFGLLVFSEKSGKLCHKLHSFSVFYLWFSFAKPPKYSSQGRQTSLPMLLEMPKPVIYTLDKNLEIIILNLVCIGVDPLPFLIKNLIHIRVVCCLSRSIERMSGMLL